MQLLRPVLGAAILTLASCPGPAPSRPTPHSPDEQVGDLPEDRRESEATREDGEEGDDDDAPAQPSGPSGDAGVLLAEHNRVRAAHCAAPLTWSDELAAVAQKWADSLRDSGCAFEHSRTQYGENLAAGTSGALDAAGVVAMWYGEASEYSFARPGFSMNTGHFTQVVWGSTQRLGCGASVCKGMTIWVCNYDPPGNYEGQYRDQVKPTSCAK